MLSIRMQRTGRKGHAMFRVVVQQSRLTPTSGRVIAQLGHYDPHSKTSSLVKDKAEFYLNHGAQPSDRVVRLLEQEGVALPKWVTKANTHTRTIRHPEKLRSNQPKEEAQAEAPAAPVDETVPVDDPNEAETTAAEEPAEPTATEGDADASEK